MNKLSIVIVNFNAGDYLLECLQSIKKVSDEAEIKIYIVDNASSDDSIELARKKFPEVSYILNDENLGFGKANNQALKKVTTEYILILNPDVEIKKDVLRKMLDFMDTHPEVGISTPKVVFGDGRVDLTAHRGFPTPLASLLYYGFKNDFLYHLKNRDFSKPHQIDSAAGAFMLTRKSVLEKSGLFDEDYFLYAEDIDLCLRVKKAGFQVMYIPTLEVIHHKGVSSGLKKHSQEITTASSETKLRAFNAFYESMKIFYKKHYEKRYPFFVNWLIYLGIDLKWWIAKRNMTV